MPAVAYGDGTLYRRPDGRFVATIRLRDGRRPSRLCPHRHDPGAEPCREVRRLLRDLNHAKDDGAPLHRQSVGAYLRRWLDDVRPTVAPKTWRGYEQHCRLHLIPALGHHRLSDLSVSDVRAYLRADRGDAQTVRHRRATLRRALADALRDGLVTRNVAALAEPPKLPHRERPVLTAEQVRTLIEGTKDDRLHALWVLLATTGLRSAEALGLTWEDIDLGDKDVRRRQGSAAGEDQGSDDRGGRAGPIPDERGHSGTAVRTAVIHVNHTLHRLDGEWRRGEPKTEKSRRTIILPPVTAEALRRHQKRQLEEWLAAGRPGMVREVNGKPTVPGLVFVTAPGRRSKADPEGKGGMPLHGPNLAHLLRRHLVRLGLPIVNPHDLRHSVATILYDVGMQDAAIADLLGHTSTRLLNDRYRHRLLGKTAEAAAKMQSAVG